MFSPMTNAMPMYRSSTPPEQRISVIAMTAADDCTSIVSTLPTSRKSSVERKPQPRHEAMKLMTASLCSRSMVSAFSRRVVSPRNMNEKPKINSPNDLRPLLREKIKGRATANRGKTKLLMFIWKPNIDIIHAVSVVPMFAPMMTEMACASVSRPALTKLTVMTVVAVDDWTALVTNAPVSNPVNRFVVMAPRMWRRCPPVSF